MSALLPPNDNSDDDECESVNVSETVERPFEDPDISRLGRLDLGFPTPLVYLCLQRRHGIHHFPDKDEQKIWLEFKKFDEGTREAEVINPEFVNEEMRSLEADHPIVSVVGNFAVAAFNDARRMVGEHKNLYDFEFMECKYLKHPQFYYFYMIIEVTQKGNSGSYMAEVACDRFDGPSILCKFVLTDYKPCGTKAMAVSYLSCLESICETMDDLFKEKLGRLKELYRNLKDPVRLRAIYEADRLRHLQAKVCEGLRHKLGQHRQFHFPPDRNRMTYQMFGVAMIVVVVWCVG
ncbi:hypothetical protein CTI12_AA510230 [Artemisia annua]|uniref:Uncharacterized protein n=1 Tax=Artemisia annua TaxID=35608 RepID=A0A2U1LBH5_ARTAN|nr:hypothetical protein CTI12_AA510230 [Artemisia annua]